MILSSTIPPGDITQVPIDFISSLSIGETIVSSSVVISVYSGGEGIPSLTAASSINGTEVVVTFSEGTAGVIYKVVVGVTTSLSQTLSKRTYIAVIGDPL